MSLRQKVTEVNKPSSRKVGTLSKLLVHSQCDKACLYYSFFFLITTFIQIHFTNRILNSIQKGLLLEVQQTGIYALRQDRCHVFASTGDPSVAHPDPKTLPPNTMVELLSFEKYVNGRCGSFVSHLCEHKYFILIILLNLV